MKENRFIYDLLSMNLGKYDRKFRCYMYINILTWSYILTCNHCFKILEGKKIRCERNRRIETSREFDACVKSGYSVHMVTE